MKIFWYFHSQQFSVDYDRQLCSNIMMDQTVVAKVRTHKADVDCFKNVIFTLASTVNVVQRHHNILQLAVLADVFVSFLKFKP